MPSPKVLAAVGTTLVVFGGTIPKFLLNIFSYLYGSVYIDVLGLLTLGGFLLWISGNLINYFAWRGLAGGKDTLVGLLFIISALIHIQPIIMLVYMLFIPLPFGIPPFEFFMVALYTLIAFGYFSVGYRLTRV